MKKVAEWAGGLLLLFQACNEGLKVAEELRRRGILASATERKAETNGQVQRGSNEAADQTVPAQS